MNKQLFTLGDVARFLKISIRTVEMWVFDHGFVAPMRQTAGKGDATIIVEESAFALVVAQACRQKSLTVEQAGVVARWLDMRNFKELETEFKRRRHYLLLAGGLLSKRLLTKDEVFSSSAVKNHLRAAVSQELPCMSLNIYVVYRFFKDESEKLNRERNVRREEKVAAAQP